MKTNPLLSVHLLTYNNDQYIENTLQSILMQKTNFAFEVVIGDDFSVDNTPKILEKHAKNLPSLINYQQNKQQLGILGNFKATLDRCVGKYVFAIAGDDLLKHNYSLQKMVDILKQNDSLGFVDSGYDEFHEKRNKTVKFKNDAHLNCKKEIYLNNLLLGKIIPIGVCYQKDHLYKFVDFDDYIKMDITIEDYPILVDLAMNSNFERLNESLHIYIIHKNSYSHKLSFDLQFFIKNQMLRLVTFFSKKYNLSPTILSNYYQEYYKGILHLSGRYGKKELGKEAYTGLGKPKKLSLIINYLCSQHIVIKKLFTPFRKL